MLKLKDGTCRRHDSTFAKQQQRQSTVETTMHPYRLVALVGFSALILFGCADSRSLTEGSEPKPSDNFSNGPSEPGPVVLRLHEPDWFVFPFPDVRAQLTATVGIVERFSAFCEPAPITIPPEDLQFLF